jgi:hypothetical protein
VHRVYGSGWTLVSQFDWALGVTDRQIWLPFLFQWLKPQKESRALRLYTLPQTTT